ncbi:phage tail protein [Andreprevotia chitinilytica]|uniref:phage tail protein n=1 Tax=Andreprevotia chitinilytica TaxID=396808 RepID=UPI000554DFAF|nr:tail fiber protein [Andreprevotia chitinilytica]
MSDQFVGEIRIFGFNFAPYNWAFCDGQILPISQNTTLFSILGANYGGNGSVTFGLPNLQGSAIMGAETNQVGLAQGTESVALLPAEMPAHSHTAYADTARPATAPPTGHLPSRFFEAGNETYILNTPAPAMTTLSPLAVGIAGGSTPHENRQPFQVQNFCIALKGVFPPRS